MSAVSFIDAHVGLRISQARQDAQLSRPVLAGEIGISGEQLRKYEVGVDRISAGRLYHIAMTLDKPVDWFYRGLAMTAQTSTAPSGASDPHTSTRRLMSAFRQLSADTQEDLLAELEARTAAFAKAA